MISSSIKNDITIKKINDAIFQITIWLREITILKQEVEKEIKHFEYVGDCLDSIPGVERHRSQ